MNIVLTLLGLIAWIIGHFVYTKNQHDKKGERMNFGLYAYDRFDDWMWAIVWAAILLVVGHYGLGLELLRKWDDKLAWSDLYYMASGPASLIATKAYELFVEKVSSK